MLFYTNSSSDIIAQSHVYGLHKVDIYSNSWGPDKPFYKINLEQREAFRKSAGKGRGSLGAVLVFPVGTTGNELANNEYTITVSAVGQNATVGSDSVISSSVVTSGLRNGSYLITDSMVTNSFGSNCMSRLVGVSAATAQIAGIIALALEANPPLTLADIQDLVVYSSCLKCLNEPKNITMNAAGLKFHPVFGFGLLNAQKMVDMAEDRKEGMETSAIPLRQTSSCYDETNGFFTAEFCYNCKNRFVLKSACMPVIKTVKVQVTYRTSATFIRITLISPHGTESILQDFKSDSLSLDSVSREQILTSVHFWDETAFGLWTFKLQSNGKTDVVGNVSLTLFGSMSDLLTYDTDIKESACTPTCASEALDTDYLRTIVPVLASVLCIIAVKVAVIIYIYSKNKHAERSPQMKMKLNLKIQ